MATIAEIKSTLHQYIVETDDIMVLNQLQAHFEMLTQQQDKIIAYTADGKPLSYETYQQDIDEAIRQADNGDIVSQQDIERTEL